MDSYYGSQPDSDDEYRSDGENDPVNGHSQQLEAASIASSSSSSSIHSHQDRFDSLQKLMTLVNSVTFSSVLTTRFGVRDFAEIPSYPLARGAHFQTRRVAGNRGVFKYPVIDGSTGVSRMGHEAAALELQILLHEPIRKHCNIVRIISIGWTRLIPLNPTCFPITYVEFAPHGTLAQYLEDNTIDSAVKISLTQDIAQGLQTLHSCGITHGDLKMDNVLIFPRSDGPYPVQAKLSDFGSSVLENKHGSKLRGCTPPWNAPEWHKNFSPSLLHVTDLYSLGLLVWSLSLNGKNPFEGQEPDAIEARKQSDSVLEDAIQSIEQQYDIQMLLRGSIDDSERFIAYRYSVAMPRKVLQNTLRMDPTGRNLQKVLESLSKEHYFGYAEDEFTETQLEGQKVEDGKPVVSFIRFFDAPNYVRSEVLANIKKVALDESADHSAHERAEASLQLCWAYIDGFGTPQDIDIALAWAETAAKLGSISAGGLIKRIFDSAGKAMNPDLREKATEWQFNATRWGLSIARNELKQANKEQCKLADEPFRISLGAQMVDGVMSSDVYPFDWIDGLFQPRNRHVMRQLHLKGDRDIEDFPFLSLKRNTHLHAGAAMGVDIQNFESYIKEFRHQDYIDAKDVAGNTALHVALRCNHSKHAKCLLKHGADSTVTNNRGESPYHWLVYVDEPGERKDLVDLLVRSGAGFYIAAKPPISLRDPYCFIRNGGTPLHWAVEQNLPDMASSLLENGANPEYIYNGYTPIDLAVQQCNPEILRALLSKAKQPPVSGCVSTDPTVPESSKFITSESYVNYAVGSLLLHDRWLFHGKAWLQRLRETIHVLQDFGLDPTTKHSPMQAAALASTGNTQILELLVEEGFDSHSGGKAIFWQDLLHDCIKDCQPFTLRFIFEQYLKHGSLKDLSLPDELLLASAESLNCDPSIMEKILETGVDINSRNKVGKTPLVLAVGSRNYELATFLLSHGADINARYYSGGDDKVATNILFELIVSNRDIELGPLKYLLDPLHPYADKLPDFLVEPEQLRTALHLACRTGNLTIVDFLLKKFPDKNQIDFSDSNGWTALHYAAFGGHLEVAKMLCKAGANVNVQIHALDVPGWVRKTALDFCLSWVTPPKAALEANYGRQITKEDVYLNRLYIADHLKGFNARRAHRKLVSRPQPLRFAFWAVITGNVRLLSEALRRFDMPSIQQPILDALLFDACGRESTSVVQYLIKAGANLNARSKKSNTPLHLAAILKQPLVAHLLIQSGAEVNPVNDRDDTPLSYALQNKQPATIRALKVAGGVIPIPRAVFNKMFRDMGVEPPNVSGAELPTFTFKLEGEPSDESEGDENGETGDAAETTKERAERAELDPAGDEEEDSEGSQSGVNDVSDESLEGDDNEEDRENEEEEEEGVQPDGDDDTDEDLGDENEEDWEDESEDDDET